ncbi:MAG: hypothetical protein LC808_24555 [Actinobacteria bacterium]|nr:hypothetical protein [Actinomycetota bacterium]
MAATTRPSRIRKPAAQTAPKPDLTVVDAPASEVTPKPASAVVSIKQRAGKAPTQLHKDFAEWLTAQTGHQADPKTVQLAVTLLGEYQKSPERQAARKAAKQANATVLAERKAKAEEKAAARKAKLEKQLAALQSQLTK